MKKNNIFDYKIIFKNIKSIINNSCNKCTKEITLDIKNYFKDKYSNIYYVAGANGNSQYLYDLTIMSCNPLNIYKLEKYKYNIYLVMESELGGYSASSADSVEKNFIEDFYKILQADAQYKIMIGIYSKYKNEDDASVLEDRIKKINEINKKSNNNKNILVILIKGTHISKKIKSNQVQIDIPVVIHGYILSKRIETAYKEI